MFNTLSSLLSRPWHHLARLPGRPPQRLYAAGTPLILAHRGARTLRAENTVEAFVLAMQQGADGVELDVQLTADRQVVVFHDPDLGRIGRPGLRVAALTLAQLQQHDVGSLVHGGPPHGRATIPMLAEVLEALPRHALVNVELKGGRVVPDGLEVEVLRTVEAADASDRVVYSAFNPLRALRMRNLAPEAWVGMLHEEEQSLPLRDLWWFPVVAPHAIHPSRTLCTAAFVEHLRQLGVAVHVWTVNQPEEMVRLRALRVDAIITDVPDLAVRTLRSGNA